MPTHVALLRGINLGPHKRVAMPALRALVASLGHTDVATYIASGNVVFTAARPIDPGRDLEKAIADELGVDLPRCGPDLRGAGPGRRGQPVSRRARPQAGPRDLPDRRRGAEAARSASREVQERLGEKVGRDEAQIVGRTLYLHTPDGFGRSELAKVLSRPGGPAEGTARNWATVTKLLAMCEA